MSKTLGTGRYANRGKASKGRAPRTRSQRVQALRVQALLEGAQSEGLGGVVETVYRMIDPDQPSIECLAQADVDFAGAMTSEDVWDAALDMSACLLEAKLEDVLEPDPEEPPEPDPVPGTTGSPGKLVLAALLVLLHRQTKLVG